MSKQYVEQGVIAYYLTYRREIDSYLHQVDAESQAFQQATHDSVFSRKLAKAHCQLALT